MATSPLVLVDNTSEFNDIACFSRLKMKENVLDILIYLFEHYMLENLDDEPEEAEIMQDLSLAGFNNVTIDKAFDWLENLAILCEEHDARGTSAAATSTRIFSPAESERIGIQARGLLTSLEQTEVLNPASREMVIDRLMALDTEEIDLEHVKWVILMVLTNCTDYDDLPLAWTESMVLDGPQQNAH